MTEPRPWETIPQIADEPAPVISDAKLDAIAEAGHAYIRERCRLQDNERQRVEIQTEMDTAREWLRKLIAEG